MSLQEMRLDFITRRKGSLALPMTGIIVYSAAAILSLRPIRSGITGC